MELTSPQPFSAFPNTSRFLLQTSSKGLRTTRSDLSQQGLHKCLSQLYENNTWHQLKEKGLILVHDFKSFNPSWWGRHSGRNMWLRLFISQQQMESIFAPQLLTNFRLLHTEAYDLQRPGQSDLLPPTKLYSPQTSTTSLVGTGPKSLRRWSRRIITQELLDRSHFA